MSMVTRTVKFYDCECVVLDLETMTAQRETLRISVRVKSDKRLAGLQDLYNTPNKTVVSVGKIEENEVLYGMDEVEFMKYAKPLPPRTATKE